MRFVPVISLRNMFVGQRFNRFKPVVVCSPTKESDEKLIETTTESAFTSTEKPSTTPIPETTSTTSDPIPPNILSTKICTTKFVPTQYAGLLLQIRPVKTCHNYNLEISTAKAAIPISSLVKTKDSTSKSPRRTNSEPSHKTCNSVYCSPFSAIAGCLCY